MFRKWIHQLDVNEVDVEYSFSYPTFWTQSLSFILRIHFNCSLKLHQSSRIDLPMRDAHSSKRTIKFSVKYFLSMLKSTIQLHSHRPVYSVQCTTTVYFLNKRNMFIVLCKLLSPLVKCSAVTRIQNNVFGWKTVCLCGTDGKMNGSWVTNEYIF